MLRDGSKIPDEVLDRAVTGLNLSPGSLRDQLAGPTDLLVFLRHFGCIFCRETLTDLRTLHEQEAGFPRPLFFFQGSPTEGRALLRGSWPQLRAISDPKAEFYEGFDVQRGGLIKMFGPGVWSAKTRAETKGHRNGERMGDIWRMPGMFLTRGSSILWHHDFRHAGDHPDYQQLGALAAEHG